MTTSAVPEATLLAKVEELIRRGAYNEFSVLDPQDLTIVMKCSMSQVMKLLPKLSVSYALGPKSPRVIMGDLLQYLRDTNINKS